MSVFIHLYSGLSELEKQIWSTVLKANCSPISSNMDELLEMFNSFIGEALDYERAMDAEFVVSSRQQGDAQSCSMRCRARAEDPTAITGSGRVTISHITCLFSFFWNRSSRRS